jgi:hypothetical protein
MFSISSICSGDHFSAFSIAMAVNDFSEIACSGRFNSLISTVKVNENYYRSEFK